MIRNIQEKSLTDILNILSFSESILKEIQGFFERNEKRLVALGSEAFDGEVPSFPLLKRKPLTRLAVLCFLMVDQYRKYIGLGVPEKIIEDTFQDITLRANLYYEQTGNVGLSKEDVIWFRHIMNCEIFKIGPLQFQPFHMIYLDKEFLGEPFMQFSDADKKSIPPGTPVINVHVQQGALLNETKINQAFNEAEILFEKFYPSIKYVAFVCYSWMLYTPLRSALQPSSNIVRFAKCFDIISEISDKEQALDCIFGKRRRDKNEYPTNTTLQRLALEDPGIMGFSCGVRMCMNKNSYESNYERTFPT